MKRKTYVKRIKISQLMHRGPVTACDNLIMSAAAADGVDALVPVAGAEAVDEAMTPLAVTALPDVGTAMLLRSDAFAGSGSWRLFVRCGDVARQVWIGAERPECAVAQGRGWLVMTASARIEVTCGGDGTWSASAIDATPPDVEIRTVTRGSVSGRMEAVTLTDVDFDRSEPRLSDASLKLLTASTLSAYTSLSAAAAASGAWVQPMLARYHLLDSAGERLFSSEPLIVGAGWQCSDKFTIECSRSGAQLSVPATVIRADAYGLELTVRSLGAYTGRAAAVQVTLSPQVHPVNFGAVADYRIVRPATAAPALTVALPGATVAMADDTASRATGLLRMVERIDAICATVTVTAPDASAVAIVNPALLSAADEARSLRSMLARSPAPRSAGDPSLAAAVMPPHAFTARTVTTGGDAVVWGDVTPLPAPVGVSLWTGSDGDDPPEWSGTLAVTMADGGRVLTSVGYPMPLPAGLPPLASYPDVRAVKMELWVENHETSTVSHVAVHLKATADGARAVSIAPDLAPRLLTPTGITSYPRPAPGSVSTGRRIAGALVAAAAARPGIAIGAMELTPSPVVVLVPAVKGASSWDFTRNRIYAFSPAGIFAVAFGACRSTIASSIIDRRGVSDAGRVAYTSAGVAAVTDGGVPVVIRGSAVSRLNLPAHEGNVNSIAWHTDDDSLWMLTSSATVLAMNLADGACHTRRFPFNPITLHSPADTMLIGTSDYLLRLAAQPFATTPVRWAVRVPLDPAMRLHAIEIDLAASAFSGSVRVRTDGGAGSAESFPLLDLALTGQINAPVRERVAGLCMRFIIVEVEALVSADFRLTGLKLHCHD